MPARPDIPSRRMRAAMTAPAIFLLACACAAISLLLGAGVSDSVARAEGERKISSAAPHISVGEQTFPVVEEPPLRPEPGWPIWLKDPASGIRTEKTSGIAFVGRDANARECFFLVDETGFFHFCRIATNASGSAEVRLEPVRLEPSLLEELRAYRKWDFEELAIEAGRVDAGVAAGARAGERAPFDTAKGVPDSVDGFVCVEGEAGHEAGTLAAVRFVRDEIQAPAIQEGGDTAAQTPPVPGDQAGSWRIVSRGEPLAGREFWSEYAQPGRGLKGAAASNGFLFLGLDNLGRRGDLPARGSLLFFYDRLAGRVAQVNSASYGIYSVGGIAAVSDSVLIVLDRSRMCITVMKWDPARSDITQAHRFPLDLYGPGGFRYGIPNLEGITVDDRGDIWMVCDPEFGHYRAMEPDLPEIIHVYLAAGIPMLYRFPGAPVWAAIE